MAAEEEETKEYRWETGYEKTWEAIKEDDDGNLDASVAEIIQKAKRKAQLEKKNQTRLGMMRHLYVILDASEPMLDQDLKPTRQICVLKLLEEFVDEYLYESPLSQLGFIITRNKRAEKISDLSGSVKKHVEALKANYTGPSVCKGEPSLQNGLELALSSLKNMPPHSSREALVIMGSLTTCDPSDINNTIQNLKECGVRVSVVGVGAEVRICSVVARETSGTYRVALDDVHLRHLLREHIQPPPAVAAAAVSQDSTALIKMGFPHHAPSDTKSSTLAMCICHVESESGGKLDGGGYACPQCRSKYCELPVECRVCGLTLVSAPHLARSYHHLFPVDPFSELPVDKADSASCYTCLITFKPTDRHVYRCDICWRFFCLDCDMFIHDTLHTCPGCATNRDTYQKKTDND